MLRDLRRTDTTEHDLQHEYDKYRRAELMQSYGASERQIETMLKESDEMYTSTPRREPARYQPRSHAADIDDAADAPDAPAIPPKAPPPPSCYDQCYAPCYNPYNRAADPAVRVALIQLELAEAEAALAAKNERDALAAKIDAEIALAEATRTLLADIRILRLTDNQTHRRKEFAQYRKELAALSASYDVKIVLVGDKSAAVLVLN